MNFRMRYLLLLPCMLALFACQQPTYNTITIGILDGPTAVSFIEMIDNPPIIQGRKIEFIVKSEPLQIQALMMQKKLDFAVLPTVMAANLYNKGVDYKLVAIPIWGSLYLISNETGVDQLKELAEKKIHVFGQGTTADIWVQDYLNKHELKDFQLDYTYGSNAEIAQALLRKQIKTAVVSEPMVSLLKAKDPSIDILIDLNHEWRDDKNKLSIFAQTSFLVNSSYGGKYNDIVREVATAYADACKFTYQQLDTTRELLEKHNFYPSKSQALQSILLCNIDFKYATEVYEQIHKYLHIFYTFDPKSIGGKMPNEEFIYKIN